MGKSLIVAAAGLALLVSTVGKAADPGPAPTVGGGAPGGPTVDTTTERATQVPPSGPPIVLEAGKGTLIRLSGPANTVFIANSDIADVTIKTPSLIYVSAKAPGETALYA